VTRMGIRELADGTPLCGLCLLAWCPVEFL
jgi:hypothetical protein